MTVEKSTFFLPYGVDTLYRPEFANVVILQVVREGMTYFRTSSDPVPDGMFLHSASGGYLKFKNPGTVVSDSSMNMTFDRLERITVVYKY
jgi:hypothetical protein